MNKISTSGSGTPGRILGHIFIACTTMLGLRLRHLAIYFYKSKPS